MYWRRFHSLEVSRAFRVEAKLGEVAISLCDRGRIIFVADVDGRGRTVSDEDIAHEVGWLAG